MPIVRKHDGVHFHLSSVCYTLGANVNRTLVKQCVIFLALTRQKKHSLCCEIMQIPITLDLHVLRCVRLESAISDPLELTICLSFFRSATRGAVQDFHFSIGIFDTELRGPTNSAYLLLLILNIFNEVFREKARSVWIGVMACTGWQLGYESSDRESMKPVKLFFKTAFTLHIHSFEKFESR